MLNILGTNKGILIKLPVDSSYVLIMALWVMENSREGQKTRKFFSKS